MTAFPGQIDVRYRINELTHFFINNDEGYLPGIKSY